ncbi:hypothetical protein N8I77_011481 [Diaporthe amygdali]|uniref:Catalase core domain-containing protein n=1 Tax=Phomopsis amygdali TaxID=1214568 RepID=A0AAD9S5I3_PHOAM|nr:hypothetical protein N8I77_011481 [Diaporthe amygdali]
MGYMKDSTADTQHAHGETTSFPDNPVYTLAEGQPVEDPTTVLQIRSSFGNGGLGLLTDTQLIESLTHFPRERIPERVVHAKAAGAWGYYEVTEDISDITSAKFLTGLGKKTDLLARISTVGGEKGSADTVRDVRGFAVKIFTEEGNQDFVFNDLPVFFLRDPIKFPSMNRSHKRHPQTNIPDPNMFWDYHNNNQEGIHALMQLFGKRGIPESVRNINAFGVHTYKLGKPDGSFKYVKWHFKPEAGIKTMPSDKAGQLAGSDPDYHVRDLFDAIKRSDFPSWNVYLQIMDPKDAETYHIPIFDPTYTWPHADYPLKKIGRIVLNRNPDNYFQDVEQAAFSPSAMVPGIAPSADIVLQARMFSYPDAARYRVGPNYQQLPCNRARSHVYAPYSRDGPMSFNGNYGADPNYVRSSFQRIARAPNPEIYDHDMWAGRAVAYTSAKEVGDEDFVQSRELWEMMKEEEGGQEAFLANLLPHLGKALPEVQEESIKMFARVSEDLGKLIRDGLAKEE